MEGLKEEIDGHLEKQYFKKVCSDSKHICSIRKGAKIAMKVGAMGFQQ